MEVPFYVNIVEQCKISPPPDAFIPPISLPLTFLDIPWLLYSSNQTLFFFPKPPLNFTTTTTVISILKQSLSSTLHHFHPLAGNLSAPPPPAEPCIIYTKGDSVSLTIAESNANINKVSSNDPRNVANLHSLLPKLPIPFTSCDPHVTLVLPLLAIQVTLFRDLGFAIGVAAQHVAADDRSLYEFIKSWASVSKSMFKKESVFDFKSIPWFDRSVISDPDSLKTMFLKAWRNPLKSAKVHDQEIDENIVQATFVLSSSDANMIRHHILAKCKALKEDPPVNLSSFTIACSLIWICKLKVEETHNADCTSTNSPCSLGFNAGVIPRVGYEIPVSYFGNCITFGTCRAFGSELLGEDGVNFAAKAIANEIQRLGKEVLRGAERWICDWDELNIRILGSPKIGWHEMDFGWGKVGKVEKLPNDLNGRVEVISLCGSTDSKDGIEIGVVLSKAKMTAFTASFNVGLMEPQG